MVRQAGEIGRRVVTTCYTRSQPLLVENAPDFTGTRFDTFPSGLWATTEHFWRANGSLHKIGARSQPHQIWISETVSSSSTAMIDSSNNSEWVHQPSSIRQILRIIVIPKSGASRSSFRTTGSRSCKSVLNASSFYWRFKSFVTHVKMKNKFTNNIGLVEHCYTPTQPRHPTSRPDGVSDGLIWEFWCAASSVMIHRSSLHLRQFV